MIRHIALISFKGGVTRADVERIERGLRTLPATIPEIVAYEFGADLRIAGGTSDFAIVADFQTIKDYVTYAAHPDHVAIVQSLIAPAAKTVTRIQIKLAGPPH